VLCLIVPERLGGRLLRGPTRHRRVDVTTTDGVDVAALEPPGIALRHHVTSSRFMNNPDTVESLLRELMPMEADAVGRSALRHLAGGHSFGEVSVGRHLDMKLALDTLSVAAAVVQCVIAFIALKGTQSPPAPTIVTSADMEALIARLVVEQELVRGLLAERPEMPAALAEALKRRGLLHTTVVP
jgi:hypothetical protein